MRVKNKFIKNKKVILFAIIIVVIAIAIIVLRKPFISKYKEIKLKNINKDIIFTCEYLNNNHTDTYIGASFYIDISRKKIYYVKYFNFKSGKVSEDSLVKEKKLSDDEYDIIMNIVNNARTVKPNEKKDFEICYRITYQDKILYTNYEQTNTFTTKILWKMDAKIEN